MAKHGALLGDGSPQFTQGTGAQQGTKFPTGYDLYTFTDGSTIEADDQGRTQNYKPADPTKSGTNVAPANVAAASGQLVMPNGQVYVKNTDTSPGAPPYVLDTNSQNNQQLTTAKTVADTNYQTAQTAKLQIDAAIAGDPTNQALAQQKAQADVAYQQAQTQKLAADEAVAKGNLAVSQQNANATTQNAGSTAQNAASTAARVGAQNQLDTAQATAATSNANVAAGRLPSQIALDTAQAQNQSASATAALQKANEPTLWNTGITNPTNTYYDPTTGTVKTDPNQNYLPTDPGRMQQQLQQQASAQQSALQQQVMAGKLTADQAASQFNQWWQTNAEPIKGDIAAAQAKAQSAIDLQQAQANNYNTTAAIAPATLAQTGASDAQKNLISMLPYVVGNGAASTPAITQGKNGFPNVDYGQVMKNATYSLPNLQEVGRQGAAAALANISPTAAMHAQMPGPPAQPPMPGMPDLNSMLNMNQYGFGQPPSVPGGAPGAPAAAAPTPAQPGAPGAPAQAAPPQWDWAGIQQRQQQSAAEQAMQAQMFPTAGAPPQVPPGMFSPVWQQQYPSAVGMPATGPVVGGPPQPTTMMPSGNPLTGAYDAGSWWGNYQPSS
jgi:hypothetical protein